jgi:hypothetical protein
MSVSSFNRHISQIIVDVLSPVVFACVFNECKSHLLLSDVLNSAISICLKLKINLKFQVLLIIYRIGVHSCS